MESSPQEEDQDFKRIYSYNRKLENPALYDQVVIQKEDQTAFQNFVLTLYKEDLKEDQREQIEEILAQEKLEGKNHYEYIASSLIEAMHTKDREEVKDSKLPIGLVQNQPVVEDSPSSEHYSMGMALIYNRSYLLTAEHVLKNSWFWNKSQESIMSSEEIPSHVLQQAIEKEDITALGKVLSYIPTTDPTKVVQITSPDSIVDNVYYTGFNQITMEIDDKLEKNGVDIGVAKLKEPIFTDGMIDIELASEPPVVSKEYPLCCFSIERGEDYQKIFHVKHDRILSLKDIPDPEAHLDWKKLIFLEKAQIAGNSGSPILGSLNKEKFTIYGIFNKKVEVEDQGTIRLLFAFSPIWEYKEALTKKMEEML